jgi:hypothetical protein
MGTNMRTASAKTAFARRVALMLAAMVFVMPAVSYAAARAGSGIVTPEGPVRDPVRGEPFFTVSKEEVETIRAAFGGQKLGNAETIRLGQALIARRSPETFTAQWLEPGTRFSGVQMVPNPYVGPYTVWASASGVTLALVMVESGRHAGKYALIDLRNYSSNVQVICPTDIRLTLHCDTPAEARKREDDSAKWIARVRADAPLVKFREAEWQFTGSPADFRKAIWNNLVKRGSEFGFDPNDYQAELAQVFQMVDTCMTISREAWQAAEDQQDRDLKRAGRGEPVVGNPVRNKLEQLHRCDGTIGGAVWGERLSPKDKPHGLGVNTSMSRVIGWDKPILPLPYLEITVTITPTRADMDRLNGPSITELNSYFDVINARIPFPGREEETRAYLESAR